jgi:hypothetical protein
LAIQLQTVITAARDRHPAFHPSRVTNAVLARALTEYQRTLLSKATAKDRAYLAQQASIVFQDESATSGAGVGGFPAAVASDGTVSRAQEPTGYAMELDTSAAQILVAEFVPASSTSTSLTKTAAGWTVDLYVNKYMEVVAGTGVGQRRAISTNSGTVLSWTTGLQTALDGTSVVRVIAVNSSVPKTTGLVTALPATGTKSAYVMKVNASGLAYLDATDPLIVTYDRGVPLPPFKHLLGGSVRFASGQDTCQLRLVTYAERQDVVGSLYAAYVMNRELFIIGNVTDWSGVASIDLRYVPIPPALTSLTDYLLLPDHAEPVLVAHAAYVAGVRVEGLEGLPGVDLKALVAEREEAEKAFLKDVSMQRQQTISRVAEVW